MLVVVGGLPATGKTTIARAFSSEVAAGHLRVDSIEQAIVRSGLGEQPVGPAGYVIAYAVAEDQLRSGLNVVADCVNPIAATRDAWRGVGLQAGVPVVEVEVVCSDEHEHRRRAAARTSDIAGLVHPTWQEIVARTYEPWQRERVIIETARRTLPACVRQLRAATGL